MFLCRMCVSMYFSPENVLCLIYWIFFCFDTWIQHAFFPSRRNKNPYDKDTKTLRISIGKELFIKLLKCFWCKPSHSSSLIGCYNAIYVTVNKIQTRTLAHPYKSNQYVCHSFFLYFLSSLCFKWKKVVSWQFHIIFV